MKPTRLLFVLAAACAAFALGCSKSGGGKTAVREPKITGAPADPPVELAAKWESGKRYLLRLEMNQQSDSNPGRQGRPGRGAPQTTFAQEYALTVTNGADADKRTLDLEILSIELQEFQGDQSVLYFDSLNKVAGSDGNPTAEALAKLIGGHVRYVLGSDNKVTGMEGVRELFERSEGAASGRGQRGQRGGGFGPQGGGVARRYLNLDTFKQMLALSRLPKEPLRVGESWPVQLDLGGGGPFGGTRLVTLTNTFRGWQEHDQKKCARVDFAGTFGRKPDSEPPPNNRFGQGRGGQGRPGGNETGDISGKFWFDPALSLPLEIVFDHTTTRTDTGRGFRRGTNAPPQSVTNSTHQTISFKLTDASPTTN